MRALAHPARLGILELLHLNGTANATECAREVGGSPQAASYHLRALAKWGLVRKAESTDGRETRWELAARSVKFDSGDDSPQRRSAARALGNRLLEREARAVDAFLEAETEQPPEWRDVATFAGASVYVTPEEAKQLAEQVLDLIKRFERPSEADRPDGSRRVQVTFRAFPRVEPKRKRR